MVDLGLLEYNNSAFASSVCMHGELITKIFVSVSLVKVRQIMDFLLQQQLNISANLTRQCVTINITNDETEENEFFRIFIWSHTNVSSSTNIYHLHTQSATVTIIDDDCKSIFKAFFIPLLS